MVDIIKAKGEPLAFDLLSPPSPAVYNVEIELPWKPDTGAAPLALSRAPAPLEL